MPMAKVNDLEIYYEIHGEGPPLLLVAGLASDSQSWQPVLDSLAADYQVIVFDNRGVGRTTPQEAGNSISRMADDCVGFARQLGIGKFHLLGHSMGGFIALVRLCIQTIGLLGGVGVEFLVSVSDFTEMSPLSRHWNWIRSILEFAKMDCIFLIGGYN